MAAFARSHTPFAPVWAPHCRVLVLGSHPSVLSKQNGFFYMNPHNRFWAVMSALYGQDFAAMSADGKSKALLSQGVALYDVVQACTIVGSEDATITEVQPADLAPLVEGAPIKAIFCNGKTAYRLFCKYFPQYAPICRALPSTSPANAKWRLADLVEAWQIIRL